MQLTLGTVQFGLQYGIAGGKHLLADDDIRDILDFAFRQGIQTLDTAPAYGDIEERLCSLCDGIAFRIVSKIPPLPGELDDTAAGQWAINSALTSRTRLGHKLYALLFHRAEDLLGPRGDAVSKAVGRWARTEGILIGASGYDAGVVRSLFEMRRISVAQLPGNALDQRIDRILEKIEPKPDLYLRSAFLQGLLLLPFEDAVKRVPAAKFALQQWRQWLTHRGMSPIHGALSIVRAFSDVASCVVGVDSRSQLEEITDAWQLVKPISAKELSCNDPQSIDPRLWGGLKQ
jgi:aryl-alcohol dehydrogenase-like predicted oxidoreductase